MTYLYKEFRTSGFVKDLETGEIDCRAVKRMKRCPDLGCLVLHHYDDHYVEWVSKSESDIEADFINAVDECLGAKHE